MNSGAWDNLSLRYKERRLGYLFAFVLAGWLVYVVLLERAPAAATLLAILATSISAVFAIWHLTRYSRKSGPAPVDRLSADERSKARIKLKHPLPPRQASKLKY